MADFSDLGTKSNTDQLNSSPSGFSDLGTLSAQQPAQSVVQAPQANAVPQPPVDGMISGGELPATVRGVARGVGDSVRELGNLAGDILQKFDLTKKAGKKLSDITKGSINPTQLELDNPISSSIGAGSGYTAAMMAGPLGAAKVVGAGLRAIPKIGQAINSLSPVITGGAEQGAVGAIQGAAMQPDARGIGAVTGGVLGASLGGVGGVIGANVKRAASELTPELARMKSLGFDINSPEALARARQELASRGEGALKSSIESKVVDQAQNEIKKIRPESTYIPDKSPNQIIVDKQAQQFQVAQQAKREAYAPLTEAPGLQNTAPIKTQTNSLTKQGQKLLPDSLPQQATFANLQDYRQALDGSIKSAKMAAKNGNLNNKDLNRLYSLRNEVTNSMEQVAGRQGLGDQFANAEEIYKTQYLPFRTFSKSGKVQSDDEIDATWQKVNSLMQSSNPNPKQLRDLMSTMGDEGKDVVGWAMLQNAFNRANVGGKISLDSFNNSVNKFRVNGLDSVIAKPDYKDAVKGINRLVNDGRTAANIKTNRLYIPIISPVIEHLMQTATGIKLLVKLGSATKSATGYRESIQALVTGSINLGAQKVMQTPQNELPPEQQATP